VARLGPCGWFARQEIDHGSCETAAWLEGVFGCGAELLVCGALSRLSLWRLCQRGIRVWHGVAGDVDEILRTLVRTGTLSSAFLMPGARCGRRERFCWTKHRVVPR